MIGVESIFDFPKVREDIGNCTRLPLGPDAREILAVNS